MYKVAALDAGTRYEIDLIVEMSATTLVLNQGTYCKAILSEFDSSRGRLRKLW
jgi:hypothetical protein